MKLTQFIEAIEAALLEDNDEPGIRDTESGDMVLTEIGYIRLKRIYRQLVDPL